MAHRIAKASSPSINRGSGPRLLDGRPWGYRWLNGDTRWRTAKLVFAVALIPVWLQSGSIFSLAVDEGIYLHGAERMASAKSLMATSSPHRPRLLLALRLAFRLFGLSLAIARAVLSIEIAAVCAAIYWLLASHTRRLFAAR